MSPEKAISENYHLPQIKGAPGNHSRKASITAQHTKRENNFATASTTIPVVEENQRDVGNDTLISKKLIKVPEG